ncbi:helix-turn-helix domain-containing protein [Salipaludibacillus sp. CF4.18]|uniref:helix-turn-helix domain-containing protein n=1 Tax=Salipaludibacillus sp. CF4.18 TaxID=3373081 RepID=UPI003EE500A9
MTIGKRLVNLRKIKTSKKQEEVAKDLGVARSTYGAYEQDKREPDQSTLIKLSDYYDVSIDYLLRGETYKQEETSNRNTGSEVSDYDPLDDLKQFMKENNMEDLDFGFYDLEKWKKLDRDAIQEVKRHFEWVVAKAEQMEKEAEEEKRKKKK